MTNAPEMVIPAATTTAAHRVDYKNGSIFFVGTATTVLRYAGFTILTDPNFLHSGDHVHLGYGLTSRRLTDPAIEIDQLPPLDLCLLSHLHGDHFDRVAEEQLDKNLPIITTPHAAASLKRKGFTAPRGLKTWETVTIRKGDAVLRITAMPGTHAPGPLSLLLPPVMGSMLEFQTRDGNRLLRLYISGDTLVHEQLREIPRRYPEIDIGLFHLGGTRVLGLMVTMDDRQGVQAIRIIRPTTAIPIHYNDYTVFKSPLSDFQKAVRAAGLEKRVVYLSHGETYKFEVPASRQQRQPERPFNKGGTMLGQDTSITTGQTERSAESGRAAAAATTAASATRAADGQSALPFTNTSTEPSIDRAREAFRQANSSDSTRSGGARRWGGASGSRRSGTRAAEDWGIDGGGVSAGLTLLCGIGIGAALMYVLDPDQGRRRRALMRDKLTSASNKASRAVGKTSRDLSNRAQGVIAEAGGMLGGSTSTPQEQTSGEERG